MDAPGLLRTYQYLVARAGSVVPTSPRALSLDVPVDSAHFLLTPPVDTNTILVVAAIIVIFLVEAALRTVLN